ncbi:hypothetical protein P3W45_001609 [Vairimorpha bombi]|jgi:pyruvate dehydrogenase E1 component alpha subunit
MVQYHLIDEDDIKHNTIFDKDTYISMYRDMLTLRSLEKYADTKFASGRIRGFCHLVIGQENTYIGLKQVLDKEDKIIGSYRCHGLAYISGISVESILGELLGKSIGNCKGKGGSMHLYNEQFYGGHGIVGAQVSLGTGIGYAIKYMNMPNVCFIFYGDGAANQGQVSESFNMAKLWKLPVVYICENNKYSMWSREDDVCSYRDYYKRGYNIPGIRIEDKDISKLIDVLKFAREHAIKYGPIIIQIDTYRTCGHSCRDVVDFYRSPEEVRKELDNDCLKKLRDQLKNHLKEEEIVALEDETIKKFSEDAKKAVFASEPSIEELFFDVYLPE